MKCFNLLHISRIDSVRMMGYKALLFIGIGLSCSHFTLLCTLSERSHAFNFFVDLEELNGTRELLRVLTDDIYYILDAVNQ